MLGAALSLFPRPPIAPGATNVIFFAGSVPFTTAGYLQLLQAANAPEPETEPEFEAAPAGRIALIG